MEYKLITTKTGFVINFNALIEQLSAAVNEAIANGWEPQGGPLLIGQRLVQAMIKRR